VPSDRYAGLTFGAPSWDAERSVLMPAKSEKQRKFMGAELARKREGKKTKTGMSERQLEDFASKGGGKKKK
jgi:hypothetical protein